MLDTVSFLSSKDNNKKWDFGTKKDVTCKDIHLICPIQTDEAFRKKCGGNLQQKLNFVLYHNNFRS